VSPLDPHSHAVREEPAVREIALELRLDFEKSVIDGVARLTLDRPAEGRLTLDGRGLTIRSVKDAAGNELAFEVSPPDPIKGQRISIDLVGREVEVRYTTAPDATALQWLAPEQTEGRRLPFVFTQCQPTHARSIFPCQDTPSRRITYRASIDVPSGLVAVMAARSDGRSEKEAGRRVFRFEMEQPIPPYLFAFAAGDLTSKDLGPRSRVWAEPESIERAAWEFDGVDSTLTTAEALFGPYDWERFDLLVMPPSFPYGGMENPRLTFLTPTLLTGDRSLVNVLAHELAHSWTGNLVTNATMNDFWLNEGFTTFAERRILEALEGSAQVSLHVALGRRGLESDVARFGHSSPLTRLRNDLEGVDPDEVFSRIPYEKGYLFLRRLEEALGRDAFDRFLKRYIAAFRFRSITTEDFLRFLKAEAPEADRRVDLGAWIDTPGIPADAPEVKSEVLDRVESLARRAASGTIPSKEETRAFSATEWQVLLSTLPRRIDLALAKALESQFAWSTSPNAEIRIGWLIIAAGSGFTDAFPSIRRALLEVGRMKYLRPLYVALLAGGEAGRELAIATFKEAAPRYHPVARAMVERLIATPSKEEPVT
jgi:leukotriene-A4 hydrolase